MNASNTHVPRFSVSENSSWSHRVPLLILFLALGMVAVSISPAAAADLKDLLRANPTDLEKESQRNASEPVGSAQGFDGDSDDEASTQIEKREFKIAVLSDLHVSEDNQGSLQKAIDWVNSYPGIDAVALLGDLCDRVGSRKELDEVVQMTRRLGPELWVIPGNHDYYYEDELNERGKLVHARPDSKERKLEHFRQTFKMKKLRYCRKRAGHLLVFLPTDDLRSRSVVSMSDDTLTFLERALDRYPHRPAIILYHAPLEGSYVEKVEDGKSPLHAAAQPAKRIRDILESHPKAFLWVAGHQHRKPKSKDFPGGTVWKKKNVTVIPVSNVTRNDAWIRLLELTPDETVVRTFDLSAGDFLPEFERRFSHPQGKLPAEGN